MVIIEKSGKLKPGTENLGIENQGISKSRKLKIWETQNPGTCYMVIRWFDGGIGGNYSSSPPHHHVNYHMLTLRLRRR